MKIRNFLQKNIYAKNIFLAIFVIILLFSGLKWWLGIYTRHGQAVTVPDVRGLSIQEATGHFKSCNLNFEVVDSVYNKNSKPGAIVETIPTAGTKVKEHRNIYITINAKSSLTSIVPEIRGSSRQAIAILKTAGFSDIQIKPVLSEYKDLALGLEYKGRELNAGERLPSNSRLVLLVGDGLQSENEFFEEDSVKTNTEVSVDESWIFN